MTEHGPLTTRELAKEMGYSDFRTCHHLIRKNRDAVHICEWLPKVGVPGLPEPVWKAGKGRDKPRPKPAGKAACSQRWREKHRALVNAKQRAARGSTTPVWLQGLL